VSNWARNLWNIFLKKLRKTYFGVYSTISEFIIHLQYQHHFNPHHTQPISLQYQHHRSLSNCDLWTGRHWYGKNAPFTRTKVYDVMFPIWYRPILLRQPTRTSARIRGTLKFARTEELKSSNFQYKDIWTRGTSINCLHCGLPNHTTEHWGAHKQILYEGHCLRQQPLYSSYMRDQCIFLEESHNIKPPSYSMADTSLLTTFSNSSS